MTQAERVNLIRERVEARDRRRLEALKSQSVLITGPDSSPQSTLTASSTSGPGPLCPVCGYPCGEPGPCEDCRPAATANTP